MKKKKKKITNKILKKSKILKNLCIVNEKNNFIFEWKNFLSSYLRQDYSLSNLKDPIYDSMFIKKLDKYISKNGNKDYKTYKKILKSFKYIKIYLKIDPKFFLMYISYFLIILLEFKKIRKYDKFYNVPTLIEEFDLSLLRTIKMFSKNFKLKSKKNLDLETKIFIEFLNLMFQVNKSRFYTQNLEEYYNTAEEGIKYIHYKW